MDIRDKKWITFTLEFHFYFILVPLYYGYTSSIHWSNILIKYFHCFLIQVLLYLIVITITMYALYDFIYVILIVMSE